MSATLSILLASGDPVPGAENYRITDPALSYAISPGGRIAVICQGYDPDSNQYANFVMSGSEDGLLILLRTGERLDAFAEPSVIYTLETVRHFGNDRILVKASLIVNGEEATPVSTLIYHEADRWTSVWLAGERIEGGVDEISRTAVQSFHCRPGHDSVVVHELISGDLVSAGFDDEVIETWHNGIWRFHARKGVSIAGPELPPIGFGRVLHGGNGGIFELAINGGTGIAGSSGDAAFSPVVPLQATPGFPGIENANARLLATDLSHSTTAVCEVEVYKPELRYTANAKMLWLLLGEPVATGHLLTIAREGQAVPSGLLPGYWMRSCKAAIVRNRVPVLQLSLGGPDLNSAIPAPLIVGWDQDSQWLADSVHTGQLAPGFDSGEVIHNAALIAAGPPFANSMGRVIVAIEVSTQPWSPQAPQIPGDLMPAWIMTDGNRHELVAKVGSALPDGSVIRGLTGPNGIEAEMTDETCLSDNGVVVMRAEIGPDGGAGRTALLAARIP